MRKYANKHRPETVKYKEGDLVLLSTKDLKWQMIRRRSKKLTEHYIGPYKIKNSISKCDRVRTIKIHSVVNVSRIRMYSNQVSEQRAKAPKPVIIKGEEE